MSVAVSLELGRRKRRISAEEGAMKLVLAQNLREYHSEVTKNYVRK